MENPKKARYSCRSRAPTPPRVLAVPHSLCDAYHAPPPRKGAGTSVVVPAPGRAAAVTPAADRAHRLVRLHEARVVDPVSGSFSPHRRPPRSLDRAVVGPTA